MTDFAFHIGIDTSNYRTSAAAVDGDGNIVSDRRRFLPVKTGERGLRQQEALFHHVNALPELTALMFSDIEGYATEKAGMRFEPSMVKSVSVSTRPRPKEGSYMPVFTAGMLSARTIGQSLGIPVYEFSHQEGHFAAAAHGSGIIDSDGPFVCFHFSGGTTEAVRSDTFEIIGGSRDISYGQLLDRLGVMLGMDFPCGAEMDMIACSPDRDSNAARAADKVLTGIKCTDGYVNLSGIETQCLRAAPTVLREELITELFEKITASIARMTLQTAKKCALSRFLFAGGVSSSRFVRTRLNACLARYARKENIDPGTLDICFGTPELCSDNAVGTALLGRKAHGSQTDNR